MWCAVTGRDATPSATTVVAAVIGDPVRHSLSPALLNAAFRHTGVDWIYGAFEVPDGEAGAAVGAMRTLGLGGLNVTMPHKAAVIEHLDDLSDTARALGAVNCIVRQGDRLVGHSTDGDGLVDTLRVDEGFDPRGRRCVVIGAGGAARAAVAALADAGATEIVVVNRTADRAHRAAALAGERGRVGTADRVADADLIVNATPLGMAGAAPGRMPLDVTRLSAHQVLFDMVYDPPVPPVVDAARSRGLRATGGIGMLVHQAARAFTLWTGRSAPVEHMTEVARSALHQRRNP